MNVDDALAIVEGLLDQKGLNDVQELIFRECWQGRQSYEEIAKLYCYDDEYIKSIAYKLWKSLSVIFGEKVKKNNLKGVLRRYLKRERITVNRNHVVGVNLGGADLSGAKILFINLNSETESNKNLGCVIDGDQPANLLKSNLSSVKNKVYLWHDLEFTSEAEVKIASALDRAQIFFSIHANLSLTQPYFLIHYQNKLALLVIGERPEVTPSFNFPEISYYQYYQVEECLHNPDRVVQNLLENLSLPNITI